MRIAKVFRLGNSQALQLPKDFAFDVDEVEISREGDAVVLRPHVAKKEKSEQWASLREFFARGGMSEDFMADGRQQPPMPDDEKYIDAMTIAQF